jgi:hypothetical protein
MWRVHVRRGEQAREESDERGMAEISRHIFSAIRITKVLLLQHYCITYLHFNSLLGSHSTFLPLLFSTAPAPLLLRYESQHSEDLAHIYQHYRSTFLCRQHIHLHRWPISTSVHKPKLQIHMRPLPSTKHHPTLRPRRIHRHPSLSRFLHCSTRNLPSIIHAIQWWTNTVFEPHDNTRLYVGVACFGCHMGRRGGDIDPWSWYGCQ